MDLVSAIARQEGYYNSGTLANRNNNPGNIVFGNFAANYGATRDPNSQFAIFPDSNTGFQAAYDLLNSNSYKNLSIADAIAKWNGQGSNSRQYAQNVADWVGVDTDTIVGNIVNQYSNMDSNPPIEDTSNIYNMANIFSEEPLLLVGTVIVVGLLATSLVRR